MLVGQLALLYLAYHTRYMMDLPMENGYLLWLGLTMGFDTQLFKENYSSY